MYLKALRTTMENFNRFFLFQKTQGITIFF